MYFTCNTVKKHCIVFKDTASPILRYYFVQKIFQRAVITLLKVMFLLRVQQSVTTSTHSGSTFFSSKNNTVKQMSRAGLKSTMSAACLLAPTYLQHFWIITSVFMKSTGTQGSVISRNAVSACQQLSAEVDAPQCSTDFLVSDFQRGWQWTGLHMEKSKNPQTQLVQVLVVMCEDSRREWMILYFAHLPQQRLQGKRATNKKRDNGIENFACRVCDFITNYLFTDKKHPRESSFRSL